MKTEARYGVECITTHMHGLGRGVSRWMKTDAGRMEWETLEAVDAYLADLAKSRRSALASYATYVARQIGPKGEMLEIER